MALLHALEPGCQLGAAVNGVKLVSHQHNRLCELTFGHEGQHLGIVEAEAARLHHEEHHVHISQHRGHGAVEVAVQGRAVFGLKTRRVHENELRFIYGAYAGDPMACGLSLVRGDADLLPHQCIEQSGLTHIGTSNDGDQAAAARGCRFRCVWHQR